MVQVLAGKMKALLLTAIIFSSFYADWLSPASDVTGDGITNLKDWQVVQSRLSVLRGKPTPEQVEALVLEAWSSHSLLDALSEWGTVEQVGNRIEVLYEWQGGWFALHWTYTDSTYEFNYWYSE
jgi:hypothetical protein